MWDAIDIRESMLHNMSVRYTFLCVLSDPAVCSAIVITQYNAAPHRSVCLSGTEPFCFSRGEGNRQCARRRSAGSALIHQSKAAAELSAICTKFAKPLFIRTIL